MFSSPLMQYPSNVGSIDEILPLSSFFKFGLGANSLIPTC